MHTDKKKQHSFKRENQVILLMITGGKKWHYLAAESLPPLLTGIISNHKEDIYCLNCFLSYSTKNKLKKHDIVCNDRDYCYVEMPNEGKKLLKYNHGETSMKAPFVIYADLECLLEKMHLCRNNPEKPYTEKKTKHTSSAYSLFTNCLFHSTKNKLNCYKSTDYMERFCKDLREHAMNINYYEKKKWYRWLMKKISLIKSL